MTSEMRVSNMHFTTEIYAIQSHYHIIWEKKNTRKYLNDANILCALMYETCTRLQYIKEYKCRAVRTLFQTGRPKPWAGSPPESFLIRVLLSESHTKGFSVH